MICLGNCKQFLWLYRMLGGSTSDDAEVNAKTRLCMPCYYVLFNHLIIDSLTALTIQQTFWLS